MLDWVQCFHITHNTNALLSISDLYLLSLLSQCHRLKWWIMLIYRSIVIDLSERAGAVCLDHTLWLHWVCLCSVLNFYHQWWVCKVCNGNISSPLALSCHVLDFYIKMFKVIRGDFVLSTRIAGLNWLEYLWLEGIALLKYHVSYKEYVKNEQVSQVTNSKNIIG